jgi:glycosyltransferase involved in cell wall biosynthesis
VPRPPDPGRPQRILFLAGRLEPVAGSHIYNRELLRRLHDAGHEVSVVTLGGGHVPDGVHAIEVPAATGSRIPGLWRLDTVLKYRHCAAFVRRAELPACDVIVAAEHLLLRGVSRRLPGVPLVYLPHSLLAPAEIRSYRMDRLQEWVAVQVYETLQRWALRHAAVTVRFTEQACHVLRDYYGADVRSKLVINPMGVTLPATAPRRETRTLRVLSVGRLAPGKRVDVAIRACAGLTGEWRLDVVGDGPSRSALERLVRELGAGDRVQFHGHQDCTEAFYREADLCVLPSSLENSPLVLLEAMSYGVPCLAMRHDGARFHNAHAELIADGVSGYLAASDERFGEMIAWLAARPEQLRAAGTAARTAIEKRHTWEAHLCRFESILRAAADHPEWSAHRAAAHAT